MNKNNAGIFFIKSVEELLVFVENISGDSPSLALALLREATFVLETSQRLHMVENMIARREKQDESYTL